MAFGYNGVILHVDLSKESISFETHDETFYRTYLGGPGIGLYYLLKEGALDVDPLGPDNPLIFASGLLTGTTAPCMPRYTVCARSPLTKGLGKSEAGGWWGPELKKAGFDALVIKGRAAKPVYLWIHDGQVEIKPAEDAWGMETGAADSYIRQQLGEKRIRIALIGPAGENLVKYACITNELAHFNGRGGMGAVMGSKNLKAIAVKGSKKLEVSAPEDLKAIARWASREAKEHPLSSALGVNGTPAGVTGNNAAGALPTNNWSRTAFDGAEAIGVERLNEKFLKSRGSCFACPIRCKRVVEASGDLPLDPRYGGPEYETIAAFGSDCGVSDLAVVCKANELCNRLGLDTISAGTTIAFAMACYEEGILTCKDTGGLDLKFGNGSSLLTLIERIAARKGLGNLLADGSAAAAKKIGKGSEKHLRQVKGQEAPMHDPRVKNGLGLQYALAPQGADHWFAQHDPFFVPSNPFGEALAKPLGIYSAVDAVDLSWQKVRLVLYTSFLNMMYDAVGACLFGVAARSMISLSILVEMVRAVTGWSISLWDLMKAGERINSMARVYNYQLGFSSTDDSLPGEFYNNLPDGPAKGKQGISEDIFLNAVQLYYEMAGWDQQGRPTKGKLLELGLDWLFK